MEVYPKESTVVRGILGKDDEADKELFKEGIRYVDLTSAYLYFKQ